MNNKRANKWESQASALSELESTEGIVEIKNEMVLKFIVKRWNCWKRVDFLYDVYMIFADQSGTFSPNQPKILAHNRVQNNK